MFLVVSFAVVGAVRTYLVINQNERTNHNNSLTAKERRARIQKKRLASNNVIVRQKKKRSQIPKSNKRTPTIPWNGMTASNSSFMLGAFATISQ